MRVTHLFAGVPTADLHVALEWYERLLGKPPDNRPHAGEAVWQLTGDGLIYVVSDLTRAGHALITLIVEDLDAALSELEQRGIRPREVETMGSGARKATIADPDGNSVALAQVGG